MNALPRAPIRCPAEPLPSEAFGWVWATWVELLRRQVAAEARAEAAESDAERDAAGHALEFVRYDMQRFRAETADGFKLGLKFLAEKDPAFVAKVFALPIADAAYVAAERANAAVGTEVAVLRREVERLRKQVQSLTELAERVQWITDELGYEGEARGRQEANPHRAT